MNEIKIPTIFESFLESEGAREKFTSHMHSDVDWSIENRTFWMACTKWVRQSDDRTPKQQIEYWMQLNERWLDFLRDMDNVPVSGF